MTKVKLTAEVAENAEIRMKLLVIEAPCSKLPGISVCKEKSIVFAR